jgi:hypothetical protein
LFLKSRTKPLQECKAPVTDPTIIIDAATGRS